MSSDIGGREKRLGEEELWEKGMEGDRLRERNKEGKWATGREARARHLEENYSQSPKEVPVNTKKMDANTDEMGIDTQIVLGATISDVATKVIPAKETIMQLAQFIMAKMVVDLYRELTG
ncbi:hypothetical protein ACH5RR_034140 [Cinchona calisaya]|uniref:Uncharacterized protein n=1 Tax=Cinchona calisaya TaxID=153742 RepID=A0ABD2YA08_9GENT